MPYSTKQLQNAFTHFNLIAACIGIFFFTSQVTATDIVTDDLSGFQTTDCWVKPESKARTDCGWLTVPEDWENPSAQKLKLPVVIFRPLDPDPFLSPVIYLSGGPGYPALGHHGNDIGYWRKLANDIFPGRALIIFDQRGAGLGSPKLECHDGDGPAVWHPVSNNPDDFADIASRVHTAYAACAARHLSAGRQLIALNTVQTVADVDPWRRPPQLKRVVLFGILCRTRLARLGSTPYYTYILSDLLGSVWPLHFNHLCTPS